MLLAAAVCMAMSTQPKYPARVPLGVNGVLLQHNIINFVLHTYHVQGDTSFSYVVL